MKKSTKTFLKNGDGDLRTLAFKTIRELEMEKGILASAREEIYGCIFGRDSLITALQLMQAYENSPRAYYLRLTGKILENLISLQGKSVNIESGEEPGKCIHEFRENNHEHLSKNAFAPWYVYPDGTLRNYDSLDSTPLLLMAILRYSKLVKDRSFPERIMPGIKMALDWIMIYGDTNGDGFFDYRLNPERKSGGLTVQNWMDSNESLFHEDGKPVAYPVAPVEVQAYVYAALSGWGRYFSEDMPIYSNMLIERAHRLKNSFNEKFVYLSDGRYNFASGIDGNGELIRTVRSSIGHCLWASFENDGILEEKYIRAVADRLFDPDLFEPLAGIRTLSSKSSKFEPNSYHNGSIWPHDSGLILQGLRQFGFNERADQLSKAISSAINHFQTPIELFSYDGSYSEYRSANGQSACKKQAWSAATLLIL